MDGLGAFGFGIEQSLFGFAEDHHRGTAVAGGDAETGGETDGLAGYAEGGAEDVLAEALGQHDGADGAAAGEGDEEFVFAGAAEEVVAGRYYAVHPGQAERAGAGWLCIYTEQSAWSYFSDPLHNLQRPGGPGSLHVTSQYYEFH